MPDKKLTDSEIVKALECCASSEVEECKNCPYVEGYPYCDGPMERDVLDLINRLQAEIERLQNRVDEYNIQVANQREQIEKYEPIKETLCVLWENMLSISVARGKEKPTLEELAEAVDYIKAKAYKEFAEKGKSKLDDIARVDFEGIPYFFISKAFFDNLLKEMEGGASEVED